MILTIDLPDDRKAPLIAIARAHGLSAEDSGSALLTVLQDSPYPEVDLALPRDRVPVQVRDIVL